MAFHVYVSLAVRKLSKKRAFKGPDTFRAGFLRGLFLRCSYGERRILLDAIKKYL